jgi:archaellum biogenesis ATPase FlaH
MADAIDVVVFDSLEQITTYVLEEQQDWVEDKIRAVRKLLKPGQTVLDIERKGA